MDKVDELYTQIEDERPLDVHEPPMDLPTESLDEEDMEDLMHACFAFAAEVTCISKSKVLCEQAQAICTRLEKLLAWHRLQ